MKGKIVISQLYEQVNMQKSSKKCKTLARAKQYRLLHPTEGWQKGGGTTMCPLHRRGSTCFAAFLQIHKCLRLYRAILPFMAATYVLGLSPDRAGHYPRRADQDSSEPPISSSRRSRPRCFHLRAMTRAFDLPSDTLQARWAG